MQTVPSKALPLLIGLSLMACTTTPRPTQLPPPPVPLVVAKAVAPVEWERATSYTTIGEVVKQPILFKDSRVRVRGKVVRSSRVETNNPHSATVFEVADDTGQRISVVTEKSEKVKKGQMVTVEGIVTLPLPGAPTEGVRITTAQIIREPTNRRTVKRPRSATKRTVARKRPDPSTPAAPTGPAEPQLSHEEQHIPVKTENDGRVF